MPVYVLRDFIDFHQFRPILDEIFNGAFPFNVIKVRHTGPSCRPEAWDTVRKTLSKYYWIYIEPQLRDTMLQYLEYLRQTLEPEDDDDEDDDDEEDDDPDLRAYPSKLMTCPFCGHHFDAQETLVTRGVLFPRQLPHPLGGAQ